MRLILKWNLTKFARTIVATLLNKYDCFICIEGGTGTGKSTIAVWTALYVSREFKRLYNLDEQTVEYYYERIGKKLGMSPEEFLNKIMDLKKRKAYYFVPRRDLIYSQKDMQKCLASWNRLFIPDEMINVTFNRDFQSDDQKNIIKMINMFRDHENLIISCVPSFQNLDVQIKNLCKIKLTVKKRGMAIVHTPNKVVYCKDKWDQATNEKIEREWILKKIQNPNYSKLTTFRGLLRFPALPKKMEALYQEIKNEKRAVILKNEMNIVLDDQKDPFSVLLKRLTDGAIKNGQVLDGFALSMGMTSIQLKTKLRSELQKMNKATGLNSYYWEKKARRTQDDEDFGSIA